MTKDEKIIEKAKQLMLLMNEDGSPVDGFRFREFVLELRAALQDEGEGLDKRVLHINATTEFLANPKNVELINKMIKEASEVIIKKYEPIELKNLKNPE